MADLTTDVVIVGGCGRVGLPLGIVLADRGASVVLYDIAPAAVAAVNDKRMPFDEPGAAEMLTRAIDAGRLRASTDRGEVGRAAAVVVVIGTPIDEYLNPNLRVMPNTIAALADELRESQLLVLRSTLYPGVTAGVERLLAQLGKRIDVVYCPERIAEGKALVELTVLPQIVSARTERAFERAEALFGRLTDTFVRLSPEEAELAKLFTNTYRYIKFAIANQFFMIANEHRLDFERIRSALAHDYPRAADLPGPGFAAGPCLLKDAMYLAAFNNNAFTLGHASMLINEGLPLYVVSRADERYGLDGKTVGILGMAFKGESDDTRASLSYKLKRILQFRAAEVLCTDPYVRSDADLLPLDDVLARADLLFIAAPHRAYQTLSPRQPVVDLWNVLGHGVTI